ncbi:hypothetical protein [Brachyspira pilosicoli]|uniref:hypothetical protein n=1 Tax=Brachyspira pilosicoli TaxID=52584 RepID=UPI000E1930AA|nr:hypothetical protein [Brachyspira pilosicoli]SUW01006.1 Uncharacterised protein [Brachyspira pilosicoli]SUW05081.1 Uncharacterised protein [Brachyspira pilosicoli]SUW09064.1 Uncharacterised protein [Brachyspira pilosicoli]
MKLTLKKLNNLLCDNLYPLKKNIGLYGKYYPNSLHISQVYYFDDNNAAFKDYELKVLNNKIFVIENGKVLYCFNHYKKVIRYVKKIFENLEKAKIKFRY